MKKYIIVLSIIAITLLIFFLPFLIPKGIKIFSTNTGLYFFSALLQSNAAILSVFGVFLIFRIQSYQSSIDIIHSSLLDHQTCSSTIQDIFEFIKNPDLGKKKSIASKADEYIRHYYEESLLFHEKIANIKKTIKLPTYLLGFGIILNLFSLLLSNLFNNLGLLYEIRLLLVNLIIEIIVILLILNRITNALIK